VSRFTTRFGSLEDYQRGHLEIIDDEPYHYAFSNVYEVASRARPYEEIAVGRNRQYVLEAIRAEGTSEWRTCSHDEFALMDGEDRDTGQIRSKVVMKPGDVAAMPADIRHQGYAPKRSMLLVWENADGELPGLISSGKLPTNPVEL
jgi:hypothetical protein